MKIPTFLVLTTILFLTAGRAAAQSRDGATDARTDGLADAARPTDARGSDAAAVHDGAADGAHGGAAPHDAAPAPVTPFFFNESPGCSIGGGAGRGSWLLSLGLLPVALVGRRRRRHP